MNDPRNSTDDKLTQASRRGLLVTIPRKGEPTSHEDRRRHRDGGAEWPTETIERLAALWETDLSCADIARELGRSKNSVVGKSHRLGLPARESPIRPKGSGLRPGQRHGPRVPRAVPGVPTLPPLASADKPKRGRPPKAAPPPVPPAPRRVLDHGRLGGIQNSPRHTLPSLAPAARPAAPRPVPPPRACAWPLNDRRPWRFCDDASAPGQPYCAEHCRRAFPNYEDA
jgi:GcrA cell cycle regulator